MNSMVVAVELGIDRVNWYAFPFFFLLAVSYVLITLENDMSNPPSWVCKLIEICSSTILILD